MSMMKRSVFMGFFLLGLISMIHSACWHEKTSPGATHCQDATDKTWHPVGSTWTNKACHMCWCHTTDLRCCDGWPTRVTGGCAIKYDYRTCTYDLIVTDENIPCGAAGK